MIKQTATYGVWKVNRHDDGKVEIFKDGELVSNNSAAFRDIAAELGMEVDPEWRGSQLRSAVMKAMQEAETPKPAKEETPKEKKTMHSDNAALEAALAEIAELKAEVKRLKAELAKSGNAEPAKEEKKSKSKDPFEGLMVKVCAGMFNQKSYTGYSETVYPGGDRRKKPESKWHNIEHIRKVKISKEYLICKYVVTQAQWKAIMGEGFNMSECRGDDLPVTNVTYDEIMQFIEKLNKLTGKKYRLPTEAEWTWAAMGAGKDEDQGKYAGCNEESELEDYAWYYCNSESKTHPVGTKKTNELGLYDMSGNVWECCQDFFKVELGNADVIDPVEEKEGESNNHVAKGGSAEDVYAIDLRCQRAGRWAGYTVFKSNEFFGFRLAL